MSSKKRRRPLEATRPDVQAKRHAFLTTVRRIPVERLVFLDESGMHLAMSRSHTWVKRGTEYLDPVPVNWGTTLTLLGAIRVEGWVVLRSMFATANGVRFVAWLTTHLLPKLRRGDVLVMDNLRAHHNPRVTPACRAHGVRVLYLPPYSPDLNPIEAGGRSRSSTSARSPRERRTRCGESHGARATASRPTTAVSGLSTPVIRLNSGDPWG